MTDDRTEQNGRNYLTRRSWLAVATASVALPTSLTQVRSAQAQGYGIGGYGEGSYGGSETQDEDVETETLAVQTHSVTDVEKTSAWLTGELTEFEGFNSATVWFEWGESSSNLPNATAEQTLDSTGEIADELVELDADTEYQFRAVAVAGDSTDTGEKISFTTDTDDESDDSESSAVPEVTKLTGEDVSNNRNPHVEAELNWQATIDDSELYAGLLTLSDQSGELKSWKYDLSGESAEGTETKRIPLGSLNDGTEYTVDMVVYSYYGKFDEQTIIFTAQ